MQQQQVLVPIMTPLTPLNINHSDPANNEATPAATALALFPSKKRSLPGRRTMSTPDEEQVAAYDHDIARAIRSNDLDLLRELLEEGRCFTGCNRNGETLMHLACRRSDWEIVEFMIQDAGVSTDCHDTMGRTCLHDACWRPVPNFDLMHLLLRTASPLLLVEEDCRGHTCMDYVRKSDHAAWNSFLTKSSSLIQRRAKLVSMFA